MAGELPLRRACWNLRSWHGRMRQPSPAAKSASPRFRLGSLACGMMPPPHAAAPWMLVEKPGGKRNADIYPIQSMLTLTLESFQLTELHILVRRVGDLVDLRESSVVT